MKIWVGRWIIFVGIIHCAVGFILFFDPLVGIFLDGVWDAVDGYEGRPLAFWFEFVGMLTMLFGAVVDWVEKKLKRFPVFLTYGFLILNVLAIVTMPVGGGWLLVPATVGLVLKTEKSPTQVSTL